MKSLKRVRAAAAGCLAFGALAFGFSAFAEDKEVRVYNWSDYIDESILEDFTKETGIKVVYDVFDSNEMLETKLLAGGTGYDVVVPTGTIPQPPDPGRRVPEARQVASCRTSRTCGPSISDRVANYDPGNEYAIDYMWGTTGVGYNEAKIKERMPDAPVDSLDMIFKPEIVSKFKDCGVIVLDSPDDILPVTSQLSRPRSQHQQARGPREGGQADGDDPAVHPEVPLLRVHQRARQRRHLHGARLVGRHPAGSRPRHGGQERSGRSSMRCRRKARRCGST